MKQTISLILVFCAALAVSTIVQGGPDEKEEAGDPTAGATYIGVEACSECHAKEHSTWAKSKHSTAWKTLPAKYRTLESEDPDGRACITCHVTGFGEADRGGFDTVAKSKHLLSVQCEACHGPGSKHQAAAEKLKKKRLEEFPEGEPTFMIKKPTSCSDCHNPHISHEQYKEGG